MNRSFLSSTLSFVRSVKLHWTAAFALGVILGAWPLLGGAWIPLGAAVGMVLLFALLTAAGVLAFRMALRRSGVDYEVCEMGPVGLFLPRALERLAPARRIALAMVVPLVYLAAGLLTLPFLLRAGGLEGVLAAWDWWSFSMVAARFSLMSLILAAAYLLPVYPLAGVHVIESILEHFFKAELSHLVSCRIAQLTALGIILWFGITPVVLVLGFYLIVAAEQARRTHSAKKCLGHERRAGNVETDREPALA